ncbi:MAG: carboxylesterase family protein [Kofleriaceae bacterium]
MSSSVAILSIAVAGITACAVPGEPSEDRAAPSAAITDTARSAAGLPSGDAITRTGPVHGVVAGDLAIFRGIPYAAAPTGARRFAPPVAPAPWTTPRAAAAFGPACPQNAQDPAPSGTAQQSEDCLSINVWAHTGGAPRPVIVWIHGGGYIAGTAASIEYDGAALAHGGDAVVVSFNYRLGVLGFLALPQLAAADGGTGNWGLRDQIAALAWVSHNIAAFGGDPTHVMIAGESAGGASVCTLLAAPAAQGLFSSAAMQSGNCRLVLDRQNPVGTLPPAFGVGVVSAIDLGCVVGDIAGCLRAKPTAAVLATQAKLPPTFDLGVPIGPTLPVVDGVVLDRRPMDAIRAGRGNVPIIAGANHDDTSAFITTGDTPGAFAAYLQRIGQGAHSAALLALYPPQQLGERNAAIAYSTDVAFACPALELALVRPQTSRLYELDRPVASGPLVKLGAVHGLDFIYLFGSFAAWGIDAGPERALSTAIQQLWSTVARGQALPVWPTVPWIAQLDTSSSLGLSWRGDRCGALALLGIVTE